MSISKGAAFKFVILLGVVSLFADMTYEGAHSITGPYLAILGASAATVGIVAGFGEFMGYGLRLLSGYVSDRTGKYWTITMVGYFLNLIAVPLLALAGSWEIAVLLIIAERMGKAIRTPSRDTMLSHATKEIGRGWGFGLHEAMDQIGAVLGPLIVATVMYFKGGYSESFGILLVPAVMALLVLAIAKWLYPRPRDLETSPPQHLSAKSRGFPRIFWFYVTFVAISVAGYTHFQLISYHFKFASVISDAQIPLLFAIAMSVDALVALIIGRLFDRKGLLILITIPILTVPVAPLVFSTGIGEVLVGVILWGAVMGIQETIMRAAIANIVPVKRGFAYGLFNTIYGLSWFLGSTLMGVLYDVSIIYIIAFSVTVELASFPLLFIVIKEARRG